MTTPTRYGTTADVVLLDDAGNRVRQARDATTAEVREYDSDGNPVARHYLERRAPGYQAPPPPAPGVWAVDETVAGEPTKATWDVWVNEDGTYRLAETAEDWLSAVGMTGAPVTEQRALIGKLVLLPAFDAAPNGLQESVYAWLDATAGR